MGRVKFAVKEIKYKESSTTGGMDLDQGETQDGTQSQPKPQPSLNDYEEFEEVESLMMTASEEELSKHPEDERPRCRFCWMTNADKENPLFTSCKCSGSVGFIHFECLKNWLEVKKQFKVSPNFSSFYWKSFECEICKKAYPCKLHTLLNLSSFSGHKVLRTDLQPGGL